MRKPKSLIHCHYRRQAGPQPICLEIATDAVRIDYDAEIGNAVSSDVWYGTVRRIRFPNIIAMEELEAEQFITQHRPLITRIQDGMDASWNGNNYIGTLTDDARDALETLTDIADAYSNNLVEYVSRSGVISVRFAS